MSVFPVAAPLNNDRYRPIIDHHYPSTSPSVAHEVQRCGDMERTHGFRLDDDLVEAIDAYAERMRAQHPGAKISRANALRTAPGAWSRRVWQSHLTMRPAPPRPSQAQPDDAEQVRATLRRALAEFLKGRSSSRSRGVVVEHRGRAR